MRRLWRASWKLQNIWRARCMTSTSNRGTRNSAREQFGASPTPLPRDSRNWGRSRSSRRQPSSESSWRLDSLSRSEATAAPAGPPLSSVAPPLKFSCGHPTAVRDILTTSLCALASALRTRHGDRTQSIVEPNRRGSLPCQQLCRPPKLRPTHVTRHLSADSHGETILAAFENKIRGRNHERFIGIGICSTGHFTGLLRNHSFEPPSTRILAPVIQRALSEALDDINKKMRRPK
jgi:hypothetical protein